jgi:hypothetical protein
MTLWRKFEFRGRDPNHNPFVDFGFVEVEEGHLALSSHMLREPLWVHSEDRVIPTFKGYYEGRAFAQLRYKVLWKEGAPIDTPFEEGWVEM